MAPLIGVGISLLFKVAEEVLGSGQGPLKMKFVSGAAGLLMDLFGQKRPDKPEDFLKELEALLSKAKERPDWEEASILKIGGKEYRIKIIGEVKK